MEYAPPPFFKQGPSAFARLLFFAVLAIALLVVDARYKTLVVVRQAVGTVLYPLQRAALVPRDAALRIGDYFSTQTSLLRENEQLRRDRLQLAQTAQVAEQRETENAQLRRLLEARARLPVRSVHAEILYDARDPFSQKVVINRGTQHGVALGAPVIDDRGVLGQVVRVFPFTSEVALVTDVDQSIPVQVLRNDLRAVAYGGPGAGSLELRFLAANADVVNGDVLVTSGLDGVYPAGFPVAKVVSVVRGASAFAQIVCTPIAAVNGSPQVLVLIPTEKIAPPPAPAEPPPDASQKRGARK